MGGSPGLISAIRREGQNQKFKRANCVIAGGDSEAATANCIQQPWPIG